MLFRRIIPIVALFLIFGENGALAFYFDRNISNGQKNYQQKQYEQAFNDYLEAQIDHPGNQKLQYNLGNSAYKSGKYVEAETIFSALSRSGEQKIRQKSTYNLGNTLYRQGKLEEAAQAYRDALKLDSQDLQAKKNLEKVLTEIKKKKEEKEQQKKQDQEKKNKNEKGENKEKKQNDNKEEPPKEKEKSQSQPEQQVKNKKEAEKWLEAVRDFNREVNINNARQKNKQYYRGSKDW